MARNLLIRLIRQILPTHPARRMMTAEMVETVAMAAMAVIHRRATLRPVILHCHPAMAVVEPAATAGEEILAAVVVVGHREAVAVVALSLPCRRNRQSHPSRHIPTCRQSPSR